MKRLLLIRHGEVAPNYKNRFIGVSDPPLGPTGKAQAGRLQSLLESHPSAHCITSPLTRAVETAKRAISTHGHLLEIRQDLMEINFGSWEGKHFEEISRGHSSRVNQWVTDEASFTFPEGESVAGFHSRVGAIKTWLSSLESQTVVLFTHGGVIRSLLCQLLDMPTWFHRVFTIHCGTATALYVGDNASTLVGLNFRSPKDLSWPK